jgi:hypothetical protein
MFRCTAFAYANDGFMLRVDLVSCILRYLHARLEQICARIPAGAIATIPESKERPMDTHVVYYACDLRRTEHNLVRVF